MRRGFLFEPVDFADLPGWSQDAHGEALPALRRSCDRLLSREETRPVGPDGLAGTVADWRGPCEALALVDADYAPGFFEDWFRPFAVIEPGDGHAGRGPFHRLLRGGTGGQRAARRRLLLSDPGLARRPGDGASARFSRRSAGRAPGRPGRGGPPGALPRSRGNRDGRSGRQRGSSALGQGPGRPPHPADPGLRPRQPSGRPDSAYRLRRLQRAAVRRQSAG